MSGAALVIGQGIQAYASYKGGMDKAGALRAEAMNKRSQAAQVDIAGMREVELAEERSNRTRDAQISAFGRSGTQMSGTNLFVMEEAASKAFREIESIKGAYAYRKRSLLTEADYNEILAKNAIDAGFLGALGAGMGAFSKNPYTYDQRVSNKGGSGGAGNIDDATPMYDIGIQERDRFRRGEHGSVAVW